LTAGSREIESQEARKRSHFLMSELQSSLQLSRDRCKKLSRFFSTYSLVTSTFGQRDCSAAQISAIEYTRFVNTGYMRETVL